MPPVLWEAFCVIKKVSKMSRLSRREKETLRKNLIIITVPILLIAIIILIVVLSKRTKKDNSVPDADKSGIILIYTIREEHTKEEAEEVVEVMKKRASLYSDYATVEYRNVGDIVVRIPMNTRGYNANPLINMMSVKGEVYLFDENNNTTYTSGNRYFVLAKNKNIISAEALIEKNPEVDYDQVVLSFTLDEDRSERLMNGTADGRNDTFYIYLDGRQIGKAYVRDQVKDGTLKTYDIAEFDEAQRIADIMNSGSYPVDVDLAVTQVN